MTKLDIAGLLIVALVLVGVAAMVDGAEKSRTRHPGEFVCEIQGKLSERHVGVRRATPDSGMWAITYVDGDGGTRHYKQRAGETCAVEFPTNGS